MAAHAVMLLSNAYTHDPRVRNEVRSLTAAGFRITVVCWDRHGDHAPEERLDGAHIVRVRNTPSMRLLARDLFRLGPLQKLLARTVRHLHAGDPFDLVHAHDQDTLGAGVRLRRRLGVPLLYDAHEIFGHMLAKDLPGPLARRFLGVEARLLGHVDHVVTAGAAYREHLRSVAPAELPVDLVLNAKHVPSGPAQPPDNAAFTLVYIGTMNPTRFVLETAEAVAATPGVRLVLAGGKDDAYTAAVRRVAEAAGNIEWLGRIPSDEVAPRTQAADCVVCLFDPDDPLTRIGMPNKVFEAMAAGRPVLTYQGTYLARFVEDLGMGLAVEPTREGLLRGLATLRDDPAMVRRMGAAAREAGRQGYDWPTQEARLVAIYRHLMTQPPGAS